MFSNFKLNNFLSFLALTLCISCGGGSSSVDPNASDAVDPDEVNVSFSNTVLSESIDRLDGSALVYSVEIGEEGEYGCIVSDESIDCPISLADLEANNNEMLVTVQYLQDDPSAEDTATTSTLRAAKLPVFNPDQGKSKAGKKPYVVGQGVVKLVPAKVKQIVEATEKVLDLGKTIEEGAAEVFDFNVNDALVDRFAVGSICGDNTIDEGEQCDGGDNCDNECTFKTYEGVITEGVQFSEGYILPAGPADGATFDTFLFTVEEGSTNFIQASARSLAGDSRTRFLEIQLNRVFDGSVDALVRSSGSESLIEFSDLTPGNYSIVVTKKSSGFDNDEINPVRAYTLETIFGQSLYQTGRTLINLDQENKTYNLFFRISGYDIQFLNAERQSIQPRKLSLYTGSNPLQFGVTDIIPRIVKVKRNFGYGPIANTLTVDKKFDDDQAMSGAIYRNGTQSIYTFGVGENFGAGPELDIGEYVVVFDTSSRYLEAPEGDDVVRLTTRIEESERAGVCGNGVIERNEVCDGSDCSDNCTRISKAARLNLDTAFIRSSFEEGDGRGSVRLFGSAEEKVIYRFLELGSNQQDCEIEGSYSLLRVPFFSEIYHQNDDLLALGAERDFAVPFEDFCPIVGPINFSEQPELGDIQLLDLKLRQTNAEVDLDQYGQAKVVRYREIDPTQPYYYKSAFGGNLFASKVYFVVPEADLDAEKTSYLAVVRDADTKECMGGVTLKADIYNLTNSTKVQLINGLGRFEQSVSSEEDECTSILIENNRGNILFEVTKNNPSLEDQDRFVLDLVPMKNKVDRIVTELNFSDISEFDNTTSSSVANLNRNLNHGQTITVNFEISLGEHIVYNFPNRVPGVYYRLVTKSGALFDDGYKVFLDGAAEFESIPVLPEGTYALEIYNTTPNRIENYQARIEKSFNILPGVYTALMTHSKVRFSLDRSQNESGKFVNIQLTDATGSSEIGDCENPSMRIEKDGLNFGEIQADFCGSFDVSLGTKLEVINFIFTDQTYIPNLTSERYLYFTVQENQ